MTADERLESGLREVLALRDPGPASDRLRATVAGVPSRQRSGTRWLRGPLELAAAVALIAMGIGILTFGAGQPAGIIGGPSPTASPTLAPGMGLVRAMPAIVPFVIIVLALRAAAYAARRIARRGRRRTVVGAAVLLVIAYVAVGQTDVVGWRDGTFTPGPIVNRSEEVGPTAVTLAVSANTPIRMAVTITNTSPFPTVLRGLAQREPPGPSIPSFLGLGTPADPRVFDPATAVAFTPIDLAPGEQVDVVVLVDPGPCVTSPGPDAAGVIIDRLPLVTSTLWWDRVTEVTLPFVAHVPIRLGCTG